MSGWTAIALVMVAGVPYLGLALVLATWQWIRPRRDGGE